VTVEQASADLTQAHRKSWEAERELRPQQTPIDVAQPTGIAASLRPGAGPTPGLEARTALWVTGVALIVLLIACANVANLFLARALRSQRDTAVRVALGVSRERLLRQSLTESLVLALLGAVAGLLIAQWGGASIRALLVGTGTEPIGSAVFTDWRTLGVSALVAVGAGLVTGLAPVLLARRDDLASALKAGAREGTYQRSVTRTALLVTQFALSFLLLVGAGLFVRSLGHVREMRLGYDVDPILMVEPVQRGVALDDSGTVRLARSLLEAAQAYPGVEAAALVSSVPFWSTSSTSLFVAGIDSVRKLGRFTYQTTTPDYFRTMGTRILRGRGIEETDRAGGERVIVVSESMARVLWPGRDAIGECIRVGADTMPCTTVVGVAEDMIQQDLADPGLYSYYLPAVQRRPENATILFLRMRGAPVAQQEGVRKALQGLMPGDAYLNTMPLSDLVQREQRSWRLGATMFVAFGVLALLVAAVGLYGVIGYNVAQRMHELGVRIALGAEHAHILRLVIGQSARFAVAGIALGVVLALVLARWLEPLLFRQPARDPVVYIAVSVVLLLVTLAASAAPAWRAVRADPNAALRTD
jgi:predicted permease